METGVTDQGFPVEHIDTSRPHPARMYDYYLGGWDNYEVDRAAAEDVMKLAPDTRATARANRAFMQRAVRTVVKAGVRQIIDIGTGIPTSPNTHEIAREIAPDTRVAFVDNDVIVAAHAEAKLTNEGNAAFVHADVREPRTIRDHPTIRRLIDFDQPVALMLVAVLHFIDDASDPEGILAALGEDLPAGSHLILSHVTADFHGESRRRAEGEDVVKVYDRTTAHLTLRDHARILPFFNGYELLDPGLVQATAWRPEEGTGKAGEAGGRTVACYGGVGRKP
ncbi:SAM-dependent methyltransferase [Streptomyces xinghaiensis]|uniref:SAM-dependent methyltransferase n=1 Tax=Streptomyces xinghaiensis TaxID=1038928 RepID=UPI0002E2BBC7|nr:SAM-dependent methyltransferase [Streptomyces xinghaiensis]MZE76927.1 SAM-dependent methyltransferase [Streptomyces sp. SID5475]